MNIPKLFIRLSTPRLENDDIYTGVDYEDDDEEEQNITLTNYLNLIPENQSPVVRNPYIEKHNIQLPFRMIVVGTSGSGKTNAIHDLIAKMNPLDEDCLHPTTYLCSHLCGGDITLAHLFTVI
jgi:hypothetical protein